ncbi:MAG TPA: isochorismatase family protein [Longimicrobiales bacterium]|nr:isochorismatase family protein [Longimicrobiales bacterium]
MSGTRVGWVVDAQVDFMDPRGRLYIKDLESAEDPGAVRIVETLRSALAWMREHCAVVVFTGDWHGLEDEEIDADAPNPAEGTFPPHCMGRSSDPEERAGAEIIPEIRPEDPVVLSLGADEETARAVARRAVTEARPVFIRKNRFDVFAGNPAAEAFVEALGAELGGAPEFVVVGVARDVCVTQAVDGLQARGHAVTALRDATWGLGLEPEEATLARWARRGRVTTLAELAGG